VSPVTDVHGGDGGRVARTYGLDPATVVDLSVSLNPVAPDPRPAVVAAVEEVGRYPDPACAVAALAERMGIDRDRLLLTNGGSEAIALVMSELGAAQVVEPEFAHYRRHLAAVVDAAARVRSNPNNPTGLLAEPGDEAAVWDEAFWPLATGTWTRGDADRGAVVVGSLTKLRACPGLRLGYVVGPDADVIERLRRRQPEWSVNGLAAAALPALLAPVDLPGWQRAIAGLRDVLYRVLREHGLTTAPSDANWVLAHAPGLRERLAPQGVVVRDCASFGLDGWVRIAVPDERGLERLDRALLVTASHAYGGRR
jgi:histidinol-phosphate/aromatic aminotransferase/cobyric acid decarboxylase-like protein